MYDPNYKPVKSQPRYDRWDGRRLRRNAERRNKPSQSHTTTHQPTKGFKNV